jgi:hypothetical protein
MKKERQKHRMYKSKTKKEKRQKNKERRSEKEEKEEINKGRKERERERKRLRERKEIHLNSGPGFLNDTNVMRCILSFSASSRSVCIHPPSSCIRLRERKWRNIPAAMPGTPACMHVYAICDMYIHSMMHVGWRVLQGVRY